VGHERSKPSVFGRDGDLPMSRLGVERADETPSTDAAYDFVDGRHWIGITDRMCSGIGSRWPDVRRHHVWPRTRSDWPSDCRMGG